MRGEMRRCAMEHEDAREREDAQLCKLSVSVGMHRASAGKCPGYMMVMLRCEAQWS